MKTLNTKEEIPEFFYIFINQGDSIFCNINYHNYTLTSSIVSGGFYNLLVDFEKADDFIKGNITYAPFIPNKTTFSIPTSHTLGVINGYNVEYILEYYRPKQYPSRFSCVYAFGNYESCLKASKIYDWDIKNVKKFRLKQLGIEFNKCIKIVKCNMGIVTAMWKCGGISAFDDKSTRKIAEAYWSGKGKIATERSDLTTGLITQVISQELYEYLIEGVLEEVK